MVLCALVFVVCGLLISIITASHASVIEGRSDVSEDKADVRLPTRCETCKYLAVELKARLDETGRSFDVISVGRGKQVSYQKSDVRLTESLEDLCERMLLYSMHKEHKNSLRFARGTSQTMRTLHGLVKRGVKVELGIPVELWDKPSVEIMALKHDCESMLEEFEPEIEKWFFGDQTTPLLEFLCRDRVLKNDDHRCLYETREPVRDEM